MKGWVYMALLALLAFNVAQCAVGRESEAALRAIMADSLKAVREGAKARRDIQNAQHAQAILALTKDNDSLKAALRRPRSLRTRADSIAFFVYVTDTLEPACEKCAQRTDSLTRIAAQKDSASAAEREASDRFTSYLQRDLKAMERKRTRAKFTSRFGVFIGYATQRQSDGILRAGPVLGIGVRILP